MNRYAPIWFIIATCLAMPAMALSDLATKADKPLPLPKTVAYVFSYLETPVGNMSLHLDQGETLNIDGNIKVAGVARLFSDFYNTLSLKVEGARPDGHAHVFDTKYHSGDKKIRHMRLSYDAKGALESVERNGIHDMEQRDPIAAAMLAKAYDPLSALVEVREKIYAAVQSGVPKLQMHMYDGKRLYQFDINIYGTRSVEWHGKHVAVQKVGLIHKVVGGMKLKEKKRAADYQFPEVVLYFTADQQFLPIYGKQPYLFGAFKIVMK